MSEKPLPKTVAEFVRFHLADKNCFAPFTGQDYSAWHAFVYAVEMYGRADFDGRAYALKAMRELVRGCQQTDAVLAVFKKSIPSVLDWQDEKVIWPAIAPQVQISAPEGMDYQMSWPCPNGERICNHEKTKPHKIGGSLAAGYRKCLDCDSILVNARTA